MPRLTQAKPSLVHLAIQDGQDGLTRALRRLPLAVIRVTALSVQPEPDLQRLQVLAEQAAAWIFASSNAVRCLAPAALHWRWPKLLVTQGPGTQQALAAFGRDSLMPGPPYDSEAMLAMPCWDDLAGQLVLRISGAAGREWLLTELGKRGVDARAVSVYTRQPKPLSAPIRQRLRALDSPPLVLFTSAEAVHAARSVLAAEWGNLAHGLAIVPSRRLASVAETLGFERVHQAASATQTDVLAAVQTVLLAEPVRQTSGA